jgi:hypothetical protein
VAVVQYNIHTNRTENNTKQTIHRITQNICKKTQKLERVRAVPSLCGFYPGICLTTKKKARKNLSQGRMLFAASLETLPFTHTRFLYI